MLAILLALASAAGYGGSDYAGGLAARRGSVIRITILAQAVAAALMIFILPLAGLPAPSPGGLAWGAAAGVGEAIGALALYAGFRDAAFSVAGPISAVGSAGFSILAGLLLGERPGMLAMIGIGLALPAIIGVSASPGSARPGRGRPGHATPGRPEPHRDEPGQGSPAESRRAGSGLRGEREQCAERASLTKVGRIAALNCCSSAGRVAPAFSVRRGHRRDWSGRGGSDDADQRQHGSGPPSRDRTYPAADTGQLAGRYFRRRCGRRRFYLPCPLPGDAWPAGPS